MNFIKNLVINLCVWIIITILYTLFWYGFTKNWLIAVIGIIVVSIISTIVDTKRNKNNKKYFCIVSYQYNCDKHGLTLNGVGCFVYESNTNKLNYNGYKDIIYKIKQCLIDSDDINVSEDNIVILNISAFKQP